MKPANGNYGNVGSNVNAHGFHTSHDAHSILPPRGDYQTLLSFQKAKVVYDLTFRFAHKFLSKGDRTIDQMIQSARSGKKMEQDFLKEGGLRERMTRARLQQRAKKQELGNGG